MRIVSLFLLSLLVIAGSSSLADDKAQKQKELAELKNRIEKLRKRIESKENSKSSYHRQLRSIEKQIGKVSRQISDSSRRIKSKQQELKRLNADKKKINKTIAEQDHLLSRQVHAAYTLGQQEQIKLLFSQQNAASLQRNLVYYRYFSEHRLKLITEAQQNFTRLLENEKQIKTTKQELEQALSRQKNHKASLSTDRKKRKNVIAGLDKELKKSGKNLTRLEDDARELMQLIDSLSEILEDIPAAEPHKKFADLKGQLAWPVKGKVNQVFGRIKPPSNLRWQGITINARLGNNVRAVSHGRIAFSDWLRGMGNLIIIDHGDGYLSLYGHNQSLYKTAGEWVEAGDIIASIGDSGGQKKPALYFEIRRKGKPQNPAKWCKTSNWFATS